ncbi:MAG: SDR family NAD(P)-dependent oxidoreductase [Leptospira sp.]|jgi:short-subunit dehydrogenase|nr:SDR family NAD(P)-dependent oxidoreductase [Leptospira sp.]
MNDSLQNEWVWITGASSGIGKQLSIDYYNKGANILLSSRNTNELKKIAIENSFDTKRFAVEAIDLSKYETIDSIISKWVKKYGLPKIVIHNGGVSQRSLAIDTKLNTIKTLLDVNFMGAVAITLALLPKIQNKKQVNFVVISSVAGKIGAPLRTGYSAAKFAISGFFQALRAETEKFGIRVTIIYPGFIKTNISKNALVGDGSKNEKMDAVILNGISVESCSEQIVRAVEAGKREVVIAGFKEKLGLFLQTFFPSIFFKMIQKAKVQ